MRKLLLLLLVIIALICVACSTLTNFVIVNASDRPVEVRYRLKGKVLAMRPGVLPSSQVDRQVAWRDLSDAEFGFNADSGVIAVLLGPGDALRVGQLNLKDMPEDYSHQATDFGIEEIEIAGASGQIKLVGRQAYNGFVPKSEKTYTLTYR